jgi:hypothetical protein
MNRARPASGGTFLAEVGNNRVAGNGFYPAAFQVVIPAIEHFARLRMLCDLDGHGVLQQLVGWASGFGN